MNINLFYFIIGGFIGKIIVDKIILWKEKNEFNKMMNKYYSIAKIIGEPINPKLRWRNNDKVKGN